MKKVGIKTNWIQFMQKLTTLGVIFTFVLGATFMFADGVHADWPGKGPLEERDRGLTESGGWMKIMENHPFVDDEGLSFILLGEELPAESGGWMK